MSNAIQLWHRKVPKRFLCNFDAKFRNKTGKEGDSDAIVVLVFKSTIQIFMKINANDELTFRFNVVEEYATNDYSFETGIKKVDNLFSRIS